MNFSFLIVAPISLLINNRSLINQIIEKALEYQLEAHLLFIDYQEAFESVEHQYLWVSLRKHGITNEIMNVLKNFYENSKAHIKLDKQGETFKIGRGMKQGDPLSPNLFNAVIEEKIRGLEWGDKGIKIDGRYLNKLRFADDLILLSLKKDEMTKMGEEIVTASEKGGLEINKKKTKFMSHKNSEAQDTEKIVINGANIEEVKEYNYFGQTVSFEDRIEKEVRVRKNKARGKFWSLNKVFKNEKLSLKSKMKILESCIMPVSYTHLTLPTIYSV